MEYTLLAIVLVGGGLAWCYFWPKESDRFAHTFYAWVAMIGIAVVLNVVKFVWPGLW